MAKLIILATIITLVVLLFFLIRSLLFTPPQIQITTSPIPSAVPQLQNVVTLTSAGFVPQTLNIPLGTTVIWINNSGDSATVNSDPHPTHTDYPSLNLGNFPDDGGLFLTFSENGTYGYHNHFNPSQKGVIVVE